MPQMNQQELCNTAWALGVLGQLDKDTWEEFCACVVNTHGGCGAGTYAGSCTTGVCLVYFALFAFVHVLLHSSVCIVTLHCSTRVVNSHFYNFGVLYLLLGPVPL